MNTPNNGKLIAALKRNVNRNTMLGFSIGVALDAHSPADEIITTIASAAADEPDVMAGIIGARLTNILVKRAGGITTKTMRPFKA